MDYFAKVNSEVGSIRLDKEINQITIKICAGDHLFVICGAQFSSHKEDREC